jgi:hypothetical protein
MEQETAAIDSDREHLLNSVREAMHTHAEPVEQETAQEAVQLGDEIAQQLNAEDRHQEPGQQRDQRGRFARVENSNASGETTLTPPTSWSAESKAEWERLPPHVQQAIAKRESEVERGFNEYRNRSQPSAEIESVLAPRRATYSQFGFANDAAAVKHLFDINDSFQAAPAATALRIISAMQPADQQRLRDALNGGQPNYSPAQFQQAVHQKAQELAQAWLAQHQVREFERAAPPDYPQVKPLMSAVIANGLASDPHSAYQLVTEPARRATEQAAKINRKIAATNGTLNGAPYGVSSAPPKNGGGGGKFTDVAADVRAAIQSLG